MTDKIDQLAEQQPQQHDLERAPATGRGAAFASSKDDELEYDDADDGALPSWSVDQQVAYWQAKGPLGRAVAYLVAHGVEARGIQPIVPQDRGTIGRRTYIEMATFWAAANCNVLSFSAGMLGPQLFSLPLKSSVACIICFNALACLPVAYFSTFGPRLGLRQMVLSRYTYGFLFVILPAILNAATSIGFLSLNAILGGQTLSLTSGGTLSWSVGIVLVALIGILPSFLGLRAMHYFSLSLLPVTVVLFIAIASIAGPQLQAASSLENTYALASTVGGVLGFGSTIIGFVATWCSMASDITAYLPENTRSLKLAFHVYIGLLLPLCLVQSMGAAFETAAGALPAWAEGEAENSVAGLIGAAIGTTGGAKFLLVLLAFSVTGNCAPSIYASGLSIQTCIPWLLRVPRYFLAILITAIYLPIALALSSRFSSYLANFLYVLAYWICLYIPPILWENILWRRPVSAGPNGSYNLRDWDKRRRLPVGWAAMASWAIATPCVAAGMNQTWWTGWAVRNMEAYGDLGFILGICVGSVVFVPARWLERRLTGH